MSARLSVAAPPRSPAGAERSVATAREELRPGPWVPRDSQAGVVLDGLLVREVAVGPTSSAELLGPGDVLLLTAADDHLFPAASTRWTVLQRGAISWVNGPMENLVRDAPQVATALLARAQRRIDHLAFCQSVTQLKRIDDRVLAMLWHLAERWGRVTPTGVIIDLPITHRALGRLIGAQRPSVTTAFGILARRGIVDRLASGSWRLLSPPPEWWHRPELPTSPWLQVAAAPIVEPGVGG